MEKTLSNFESLSLNLIYSIVRYEPGMLLTLEWINKHLCNRLKSDPSQVHYFLKSYGRPVRSGDDQDQTLLRRYVFFDHGDHLLLAFSIGYDPWQIKTKSSTSLPMTLIVIGVSTTFYSVRTFIEFYNT